MFLSSHGAGFFVGSAGLAFIAFGLNGNLARLARIFNPYVLVVGRLCIIGFMKGLCGFEDAWPALPKILL